MVYCNKYHLSLILLPLPCPLVYKFLILILQIRNEKARRYLNSMRKKQPVPLSQKFPSVDPMALRLLERLLAFDPKDRPSAEEVGLLSPIIYDYRRGTFIDNYQRGWFFIISVMLVISGTSWSLLPWFVKHRSRTIHSTHFKTWVWVREKEIDQRWC